MDTEQQRAHIAALIAERASYVRAGKTERADQVEAQLRALGHAAQKPSERAERRPKRHTAETR